MQETFVLDAELYAADAWLPPQPVALAETGRLRDQAVAQVEFYPIQYNPARGEIRVYQRLVVEVTSAPDASSPTVESRWANPAYESLLRRTLLNYDALTRPLAQSPRLAPAAKVDAASAATPTLKIGVDQDGLYRLTHTDLANAGLDLGSVDPRHLQMENRGTDVAIHVHGESDGTFDLTDYVLFYGTAITDVYTTRNIYWLSVGDSNGQRMTVRDGTPSGSATVPDHFPVDHHAEEDTTYWQAMPSKEGQDRWFWGSRLSPSTGGVPVSRTYTVTLGHMSSLATNTTLRVRLKGYTSLDHRTKIHLNGAEIDDQTWSGQVIFDHEVAVPHSYLVDGDNTVRVETVDAGASPDQLLVNWIEIDHWATYVADDDDLWFGVPAAGALATSVYQFEVAEFSTADVLVFDVTDPALPALVSDTVVSAAGGGFKVQFDDTAQATSRYLALTTAQHKTPSSIEVDLPSAWRSPGQGADYILISHENFYSETLPLATHRSGQGLRVATVKVGDLYDEFNHGIFNPSAIRDFLDYAYHNWQAPAPAYVLLVGDAFQDYRDKLGYGMVNYVPSQVIETNLFGETSSDNWFATVSGDDILPDLFIGRLPAQSESDADNQVAKILFYDQNPPDATWNTDVLLVADDDSPTFETASEQLVDRLPYYYTANRIYVDDYPPGDPTVDIKAQIESGNILVTYFGHGEYFRWGKWSGGSILGIADINGLTNATKLPVVAVANCVNGFFMGPNTSVAESFMRNANGGSVAIWAPTGLGIANGHRVLMNAFYEAIFRDDQLAVGAATTAAKIDAYGQNTAWGEMVETYVLLGDPATELGIPANYPYVKSTTPADGASDVPVDQAIEIDFNKRMNPAAVALSGPGTVGLSLTPTWNDTGNEVAYSHPGLEHGKTYQFTIDGQDQSGNALGTGPVPATWSFIVSSDNVRPSATIEVEGGSLTDVPLTATVTISFTEAMRNGSVVYSISPEVPGWLAFAQDKKSATFNHTLDPFAPEQTYTFSMTEAKDLAGNPLANPVAVSFTTFADYCVYLPYVSKNH